MIEWFKSKYGQINGRFPLYTKIFRYLIAGGTASFTNILLLFVMTHFLEIWYLLSSAIAFCLAFIVSFTLQKYWTFQDLSKDGTQIQAFLYFAVAIVNLGINTIILYLLVEFSGLHYLLGQIFAGAAIAVESFFVYQFLIFKKKTNLS